MRWTTTHSTTPPWKAKAPNVASERASHRYVEKLLCVSKRCMPTVTPGPVKKRRTTASTAPDAE
jgi:hypothetical protein